jgi:hypothetical protein
MRKVEKPISSSIELALSGNVYFLTSIGDTVFASTENGLVFDNNG